MYFGTNMFISNIYYRGGLMDIRKRLYLSSAEVEKIYGISRPVLCRWRSQGVGPAYSKIGTKMYRYKIADIEDFLEENKIQTGEFKRY